MRVRRTYHRNTTGTFRVSSDLGHKMITGSGGKVGYSQRTAMMYGGRNFHRKRRQGSVAKGTQTPGQKSSVRMPKGRSSYSQRTAMMYGGRNYHRQRRSGKIQGTWTPGQRSAIAKRTSAKRRRIHGRFA